MIKVFLLPGHEVIVLPRFGNRHHHGKRKIHPVHVQEFQCIIQHRGIGSRLCDHRVDLVQVLLQEL